MPAADPPGKGKPPKAKLANTAAIPPRNTRRTVPKAFQDCLMFIILRPPVPLFALCRQQVYPCCWRFFVQLTQNRLGNQGKELVKQHPENEYSQCNKEPAPPGLP